MRHLVSAAVLVAALATAGAAFAQDPPTGGPGAKGNAPLKPAHTVNDGGAKRGHSSFTEGQARKHIEKSGYADVSPLTKGKDGVWRGTASKNGGPVQVGLDFKGNVVEGGPNAGPAPMPMRSAAHSATTTTTTSGGGSSGAMSSGAMASGATSSGAAMASGAAGAGAMHHHRRHHRHHRAHARCANPGPNGTACSGVDRNANGISDKEDRAISKGAKP